MPKIHVIYDPSDRVETKLDRDFAEKFNVKVAVLSVDKEADRGHLEGVIVALATLLMKEVWG
jgi:hypothetical protein